MYIAYNIMLLIAWYLTTYPFYAFIFWDSFWIVIFLLVKFFMPKMEMRISDQQTINYVCPSVGSIK